MTSGLRRHGAGPRRLPVLGVVVGLLVLAGIANGAMRTRSEPVARQAQRVQSIVSFSAKATSSAWYCPGPLPLGRSKQVASISVANLGRTTVTGHLLVEASTGASSRTAVTVSGNEQQVYGLSRLGAATTGAATVLVDSASVGVDEIIHGATGPRVVPCVEHPGTVQYLAPGSTEGADNLALSIYDPGATPSVVSVSFATSTGAVSPTPFQGIPVSAGHVVVLSVGHEVPSRLLVATTVHATGGSVVAGALELARDDRADVTSLLSASGAPASSWSFAAAPISSGARESFSVLNPSSTTAHVTLRLDVCGATGVLSGVVPPGAVLSLSPPSMSPEVEESAATVVATGADVVVARSVLVAATIAPSANERRFATVQLRRDFTLPPGFAVSTAFTSPSRRWLLGAGELDTRVGELVVVSNPTTVTATVRVTTLGTARAPTTAGSVIDSVEVAPRSSMAIPLLGPAPKNSEMPLVVASNEPIFAGDLLDARGSRALGFATVPGIPVS